MDNGKAIIQSENDKARTKIENIKLMGDEKGKKRAHVGESLGRNKKLKGKGTNAYKRMNRNTFFLLGLKIRHFII